MLLEGIFKRQRIRNTKAWFHHRVMESCICAGIPGTTPPLQALLELCDAFHSSLSHLGSHHRNESWDDIRTSELLVLPWRPSEHFNLFSQLESLNGSKNPSLVHNCQWLQVTRIIGPLEATEGLRASSRSAGKPWSEVGTRWISEGNESQWKGKSVKRVEQEVVLICVLLSYILHSHSHFLSVCGFFQVSSLFQQLINHEKKLAWLSGFFSGYLTLLATNYFW